MSIKRRKINFFYTCTDEWKHGSLNFYKCQTFWTDFIGSETKSLNMSALKL